MFCYLIWVLETLWKHNAQLCINILFNEEYVLIFFRYAIRLKETKAFVKTKGFENFEKLSRSQKIFIEMQLRNVKLKPKGRRFSMEEKVLALSLYKRSPRCYRYLAHLFILPSPATLRQLLKKVHSDTGINKVMLKHLKQKAQKMKEIDKYCVLMWDEMSLTPHIQYNGAKDKYTLDSKITEMNELNTLLIMYSYLCYEE